MAIIIIYIGNIIILKNKNNSSNNLYNNNNNFKRNYTINVSFPYFSVLRKCLMSTFRISAFPTFHISQCSGPPFFTRPSNTFSMASKKVLEGFPARNASACNIVGDFRSLLEPLYIRGSDNWTPIGANKQIYMKCSQKDVPL